MCLTFYFDESVDRGNKVHSSKSSKSVLFAPTFFKGRGRKEKVFSREHRRALPNSKH